MSDLSDPKTSYVAGNLCNFSFTANSTGSTSKAMTLHNRFTEWWKLPKFSQPTKEEQSSAATGHEPFQNSELWTCLRTDEGVLLLIITHSTLLPGRHISVVTTSITVIMPNLNEPKRLYVAAHFTKDTLRGWTHETPTFVLTAGDNVSNPTEIVPRAGAILVDVWNSGKRFRMLRGANDESPWEMSAATRDQRLLTFVETNLREKFPELQTIPFLADTNSTGSTFQAMTPHEVIAKLRQAGLTQFPQLTSNIEDCLTDSTHEQMEAASEEVSLTLTEACLTGPNTDRGESDGEDSEGDYVIIPTHDEDEDGLQGSS